MSAFKFGIGKLVTFNKDVENVDGVIFEKDSAGRVIERKMKDDVPAYQIENWNSQTVIVPESYLDELDYVCAT
jgi:hypothetical protein